MTLCGSCLWQRAMKTFFVLLWVWISLAAFVQASKMWQLCVHGHKLKKKERKGTYKKTKLKQHGNKVMVWLMAFCSGFEHVLLKVRHYTLISVLPFPFISQDFFFFLHTWGLESPQKKWRPWSYLFSFILFFLKGCGRIFLFLFLRRNQGCGAHEVQSAWCYSFSLGLDPSGGLWSQFWFCRNAL